MFLSNMDTYVYIDVSNIRSACSRSCNFDIDFVKLYSYLKNKYPRLKDVRYYEGVAKGDKVKQGYFQFLSNKIGYTICSLERKGYISPEQYKKVECNDCHAINTIMGATRHLWRVLMRTAPKRCSRRWSK